MSNKIEFEYLDILIFFACWYFLTLITYGTNVPAGLFLPGMILGCCMGEIYAKSVRNTNLMDEDTFNIARKNLIVLGCAGMMAGYTRMTYSLGVILMETSQTMNLFVPIIFTVIISN